MQNKKKGRHDQMKRDEIADPLSPIREFEENDTETMSPDIKESKVSNDYVKSYISLMKSQKKEEKEVINFSAII